MLVFPLPYSLVGGGTSADPRFIPHCPSGQMWGFSRIKLKRGRRWPTYPLTNVQNTFATFRKPDGRAAWLSPTTYDGVPVDVYTGVLERIDGNGISVVTGAGFGGGSLVYNGITYQPPRELFYRIFPSSVNYDELDQIYYPRVRQILAASPIPSDILATSYYLGTRVFLKQAEIAGLPSRLLDIAVNWDIVRQEINGTRVPSAIIGEHWYGINSGAKNSLDKNYLLQAEQTGKVNILPLHLVTAISEIPEFGYRVSVVQINDTGEIVATKTFTCRYLFLGAGSMGTSSLLVKAKATGTLPKLNNFIGLDWGGNGDTVSTRSGLPKPTNPGQGGPATAAIEYFDNPSGPITIAGPIAIWNAPDGTLTSLSMSIPSVKGELRYDATTGLVNLIWPGEDPKVRQIAKFAYRLLDRKNATSANTPTTETILGSMPPRKTRTSIDMIPLSAHPLGGAVLGKACDLYGRVVNYRSSVTLMRV